MRTRCGEALPGGVCAIAPSCSRCGYQAPTYADAAAAVRALELSWRRLLLRGGLVEEAARAGHELHAVGNRIDRLLAEPGARLTPVCFDAPATYWGGARQIKAAIATSVDRLAQVVVRLDDEAWIRVGFVAQKRVTVGDLVSHPLHTAHRVGSRRRAVSCGCCRAPPFVG